MMKIYTLGTSHGRAEKGRGCSGTLIESHDVNYLFDCGGDVEGKMQNLGLSIDGIRSVFISHMHEDHVGSLSSIVKLFTIYIDKGESVQLFIPEENALLPASF